MLSELTEKVEKLVDGKDAVGFDVKFDLGEEGVIHVAGTEAPMAVSNNDADVETAFVVSPEDFASILDGSMSSMNAYMMGKLKVEGDLSKAMQLSTLFG